MERISCITFSGQESFHVKHYSESRQPTIVWDSSIELWKKGTNWWILCRTSYMCTITFAWKGQEREEPNKNRNHESINTQCAGCGRPIREQEYPNCKESFDCAVVNGFDPIGESGSTTVFRIAVNVYSSPPLWLLGRFEIAELLISEQNLTEIWQGQFKVMSNWSIHIVLLFW